MAIDEVEPNFMPVYARPTREQLGLDLGDPGTSPAAIAVDRLAQAMEPFKTIYVTPAQRAELSDALVKALIAVALHANAYGMQPSVVANALIEWMNTTLGGAAAAKRFNETGALAATERLNVLVRQLNTQLSTR